jgi:hypothetical protein
MNQVQAELERFKKDTAYYEAHHEELLKKYPEQWVAVFDQQVVGASSDYEQLLTELQEKGVPIERTLFKHLTQKEELWILKS